jgi:hypothetical protein
MRAASPRIESLVLACKYWSGKYSASSLAADYQKKKEVFKRLEEEAAREGLQKEEMHTLL